MSSNSPSRWRSLLVLGRVSNLPTVWTNCLAAWWIGGAEPWAGRFGLIVLGASLAYVAGMYLNDAFDAGFDRIHRPERPIPSGRIPRSLAIVIGSSGLAAGGILLALPGGQPALWAAALVVSILIYNAVHKHIAWSPWIMATCRLFLWLTVAASTSRGVTGLSLWSGLVLGGWIIALSYVAKRESDQPAAVSVLALLPLGLPFLLAWLANWPAGFPTAIVPALLLAIWIWRSLRWNFSTPPSPGCTVSGLLAGITLLDGLAANPHPADYVWFVGAFLLSLLAQRFIPAT